MNEQNKFNPDLLQSYLNDGTDDRIVERYQSLVKYAEDCDFGSLEKNVVVLDTETTGISFAHDELTQIAAARYEDGIIIEWFVTFVNPGKRIPEEVSRLTSIYDSDVESAPTPDEALASLAEFVGDARIVAHNIDFDKTFTTRRPSGYPLLQNIWIDSLDLARIALPRMKSHRLIDLVKAFGAPLSTHRADADVEATCAIYRILLAAVWAMPLTLVHQISQLATSSEWSTQVVFEEIMALRIKKANVSRETLASGSPSQLLKSLRKTSLSEKGITFKQDTRDLSSEDTALLEFEKLESIREAFSSEGVVGSLYESFEPRGEQVEMALAVQKAFMTSDNLVVEAGTGVGKSMAYLVPAALLSKKNKITVGVATKTNALLDQLIYRELPALSEALLLSEKTLEPLVFAALKGFSHYPCMKKIERMIGEISKPQLILEKSEEGRAPALAALLSFVEQSSYDDIDGLKINYRALPRRTITTSSKECLRRRCPYFGSLCFVHGARRQADSADIIVTNHSLLLCDLVAEGGLLPPVHYWVVDEAHGIESEARKAFSLSLSAEEIVRLASRMEAEDPSHNVFIKAERNTVIKQSEEQATLFYALSQKARAAGKAYADSGVVFVQRIKDLLFFLQGKRGKGYETAELWLNDDIRRSATFGQVSQAGQVMVHDAEKLIKACQELVAYLEGIDGVADIQKEIASLALDLKGQVTAGETILINPSSLYAYSATLNSKKDKHVDKLEALFVNVGEVLNESLFKKTNTVIFASATLSVNNSFNSLKDSLGLESTEESHCSYLQLDSSYDFDKNMTIYVVSDMPEPSEPSYLSSLQNLLKITHSAQRGSMLTLFTNRKEMEKCFDEVSPSLKEENLRVVCQKWGVSVKGLKDDFLTDEHLSLFALKSFWEGFDAPGSTLKGVIIPKLPFMKPTDPLSCERAVRDDQAWRHFVLPAAVLETKQAAGRLIRSANDRGTLILADKRLLTKSYGKSFLNSMPSRTIKIMTAVDIAAELARTNQDINL